MAEKSGKFGLNNLNELKQKLIEKGAYPGSSVKPENYESYQDYLKAKEKEFEESIDKLHSKLFEIKEKEKEKKAKLFIETKKKKEVSKVKEAAMSKPKIEKLNQKKIEKKESLKNLGWDSSKLTTKAKQKIEKGQITKESFDNDPLNKEILDLNVGYTVGGLLVMTDERKKEIIQDNKKVESEKKKQEIIDKNKPLETDPELPKFQKMVSEKFPNWTVVEISLSGKRMMVEKQFGNRKETIPVNIASFEKEIQQFEEKEPYKKDLLDLGWDEKYFFEFPISWIKQVTENKIKKSEESNLSLEKENLKDAYLELGWSERSFNLAPLVVIKKVVDENIEYKKVLERDEKVKETKGPKIDSEELERRKQLLALGWEEKHFAWPTTWKDQVIKTGFRREDSVLSTPTTPDKKERVDFIREKIREILKNPEIKKQLIEILARSNMIVATHGEKFTKTQNTINAEINKLKKELASASSDDEKNKIQSRLDEKLLEVERDEIKPQADLDGQLTAYILYRAGVDISEQQFLKKGVDLEEEIEAGKFPDIVFDAGETGEILRIGTDSATGKNYMVFGNHYEGRMGRTSSAEIAQFILEELKDSLPELEQNRVKNKVGIKEMGELTQESLDEFIDFVNDQDNLLVPNHIKSKYWEQLPKTLYGQHKNLSFSEILKHFQDGNKKGEYLDEALLQKQKEFGGKKMSIESFVKDIVIKNTEKAIQRAVVEMEKMGIDSTHDTLGKFLLNTDETSAIGMKEVVFAQRAKKEDGGEYLYDSLINIKSNGIFISMPGNNIEAYGKTLQKKYPEILLVNSMILYFPKDKAWDPEEFLNDMGIEGYTKEAREKINKEYQEKKQLLANIKALHKNFGWPEDILEFYKNTHPEKIKELLDAKRMYSEGADRADAILLGFEENKSSKDKKEGSDKESRENILEPISYKIFDLEETSDIYQKIVSSKFTMISDSILRSIAQKLHDGYTLTTAEISIYGDPNDKQKVSNWRDKIDDIRETIQETRLEGLDRKIKKVKEDITKREGKIVSIEAKIKMRNDLRQEMKRRGLVRQIKPKIDKKEEKVSYDEKMFSFMKNLFEQIESNNPFLKEVLQNLLKRPELVSKIKIKLKNLGSAGKFVTSPGKNGNINIDGIFIDTVKAQPEIAEVVMHEIIHFFAHSALLAASQVFNTPKWNTLPEHIKDYFKKLRGLYEFAKSKGYSAKNSHSGQDNLAEFAVNITNEEAMKKLKQLGIEKKMLKTFFEYYNAIPDSNNANKKKVKKLRA